MSAVSEKDYPPVLGDLAAILSTVAIRRTPRALFCVHIWYFGKGAEYAFCSRCGTHHSLWIAESVDA